MSVQGAMPSPQAINLYIYVPAIKLNNRCLDLGLAGKISSLQVIKAHVICSLCFPTEVEEVEAELRQAIDIHHASNPPTLEIIRYGEDKMVNSDSDPQMFERQKWRVRYCLLCIIRYQCSTSALYQLNKINRRAIESRNKFIIRSNFITY